MESFEIKVQIKVQIIAAVEKLRAEGYTIIKGSFGAFTTKKCCPLAAFEIVNGETDDERKSCGVFAGKVFGWDYGERRAFTDGIDGLRSGIDSGAVSNSYILQFSLGAEIAREVFGLDSKN